MKLHTLILTILLLVGRCCAAAADSNTNSIGTNWIAGESYTGTNLTNIATTPDWHKYDITLGADGFTNPHTKQNGFEVDLSLSTNPFKKIPKLWLGLDQSIAWEPSFSGSTDAVSYWSINAWKEKLYVNPGWTGGFVYPGESPSYLRTGPVVELQYYATDNVFIYTDINYDALVSKGHGTIRYSLGIGLEF